MGTTKTNTERFLNKIKGDSYCEEWDTKEEISPFVKVNLKVTKNSVHIGVFN